MKIKHRLTLIVMLPLALLMVFAAMTIVQKVNSRSEATHVARQLDSAIVLSDLIHALQVERTSSAGYVGSRGQGFDDKLSDARSDSNARLDGYLALTETLQLTAPDQVGQISHTLDRLEDMRQQVRSLDVDLAAVKAYYTEQINQLIEFSAKLATSGSDHDTTELAHAYISVMRAKESAALERTMGASGFGNSAFSPEPFQKFVSYGANQNAYLEEALVVLPPDRRREVEALFNDSGAEQINRMRDAASRIAFGGLSTVSGAQWFEIATARIEQMKALEDGIGQDLITMTHEQSSAATRQLLVIGTICLLVVAVSGVLASFHSKKISRPLSRFVDGLQKIAAEDFDFELTDTNRNDEIGDFAKALSEVQTSLSGALETQRENYFKGTAFAKAITPMFVVDTDFVVTYANESSQTMFKEKATIFRAEMPGFDPEHILGERLSLFEKKLNDHTRALADPSSLPLKLDFSFGENRFGVEIAGIFDEAGRHLGNVISWDDVTETRTNAGKLAAVESSQAVIEFTTEGIITRANENFLRATGYSLKEIQGNHHAMFVDPAYGNSVEYKAFWSKLAAGETMSDEFKRYGKGGREIWILASYTPIFDDHGVPFKVVKFASDITEERARRAETGSQLAAIRKSQAVIEFDLKGRILDANEIFSDVMGYQLAEIKGKHHRMFVPDRIRDTQEYLQFWQMLERGEAITDRFERVGQGGRRVWLRASYNPILDEEGKPTRVMKIANDITDSVEHRLEAEALQKEQSAELATVISALSIGLNALSEGDLTTRIHEEFSEQYRQLRLDFNGAIEKLNTLIQSVARGTTGISGNSREITQAADDLSQRTESQAATLEQTAAALEQLTASVKSASEGAKRANEVVNGAKENAEASGEVVQRAVSAMDEIEKSSSQISQIIGVIDDIAFQTNLLALNAGVEAARAGEAGRGFAVVASEVRALAQRSSDAAKEIKSLISTSSQHVESGVELVDRAGEALKQILESVADINTLVSEIASSSNEQSIGISEINTAVNQMDQSTQQNAAMVEETTAACHAMSQETAELVGIVSRFKTGSEAEADASWEETEQRSARETGSDFKLSFRGNRQVAVASGASAATSEDSGWQDF